MTDTVSESFSRIISLLDHYGARGPDAVADADDKADTFKDMPGAFLVKLGNLRLSQTDSHEQTELLL